VPGDTNASSITLRCTIKTNILLADHQIRAHDEGLVPAAGPGPKGPPDQDAHQIEATSRYVRPVTNKPARVRNALEVIAFSPLLEFSCRASGFRTWNAEFDIKEQHEEDPGACEEVQAGQGPVQECVAASRDLIF
jgi:hypothetical protein